MKYLALRVALNTFHLTTVLQNPLQLSINVFNVCMCTLWKNTPHYGPLTSNHPTYLLATPLILETKSLEEVHAQSQVIYSATLIYGVIRATRNGK